MSRVCVSAVLLLLVVVASASAPGSASTALSASATHPSAYPSVPLRAVASGGGKKAEGAGDEVSWGFLAYASLAVKHLWNAFYVLGAVIQYYPQWISIRRGDGEGFSPLVCFILLTANILRLFYWLGEAFDSVLAWQSVVMVLVQLVVLHALCKHRMRVLAAAAAGSLDDDDVMAATGNTSLERTAAGGSGSESNANSSTSVEAATDDGPSKGTADDDELQQGAGTGSPSLSPPSLSTAAAAAAVVAATNDELCESDTEGECSSSAGSSGAIITGTRSPGGINNSSSVGASSHGGVHPRALARSNSGPRSGSRAMVEGSSSAMGQPVTIFDAPISAFWRWDPYSSYIIFLLLFVAVLSTLSAALLHLPVFVSLLGYAALLTEALLGVPQAYQNCFLGTRGLSAFLIWSWLLGDTVKTVFFIILGAPPPFLFCGVFQVAVDLFILVQIGMDKSESAQIERQVMAVAAESLRARTHPPAFDPDEHDEAGSIGAGALSARTAQAAAQGSAGAEDTLSGLGTRADAPPVVGHDDDGQDDGGANVAGVRAGKLKGSSVEMGRIGAAPGRDGRNRVRKGSSVPAGLSPASSSLVPMAATKPAATAAAGSTRVPISAAGAVGLDLDSPFGNGESDDEDVFLASHARAYSRTSAAATGVGTRDIADGGDGDDEDESKGMPKRSSPPSPPLSSATLDTAFARPPGARVSAASRAAAAATWAAAHRQPPVPVPKLQPPPSEDQE